jgi:hypothetical protein
MKTFRLFVVLLLLPSASMIPAQTPVPAKNQAAPATASGPLIVDVHPAPFRNTIRFNTNISNQRFDMRDATLLDLIGMAWSRRTDTVLGGPS